MDDKILRQTPDSVGLVRRMIIPLNIFYAGIRASNVFVLMFALENSF